VSQYQFFLQDDNISKQLLKGSYLNTINKIIIIIDDVFFNNILHIITDICIIYIMY